MSMDICEHLSNARPKEPNTPEGCEECLKMGSTWVHLRVCLECGKVGCCDYSPNKHASAHFHETHHPLIQTLEPNEEWVYCYEDDMAIESLEREEVSKDDDSFVDEMSKDSFPSSDPPAW